MTLETITKLEHDLVVNGFKEEIQNLRDTLEAANDAAIERQLRAWAVDRAIEIFKADKEIDVFAKAKELVSYAQEGK